MDFSLNEEQIAWQMKARKFAAEEIAPISLQRDAELDPKKTWNWDIIEKGSKLGFRTAVVPKEGLGSGRERRDPRRLRIGDVVSLEPMGRDENGVLRYSLDQDPQIEGALVALEPETGLVKALVGGVDYERSQFNRATLAKRQPGSAFKPLIYSAAIDKGVVLPTITDGFTGRAPDLGAFEVGQAPPHYGPIHWPTGSVPADAPRSVTGPAH